MYGVPRLQFFRAETVAYFVLDIQFSVSVEHSPLLELFVVGIKSKIQCRLWLRSVAHRASPRGHDAEDAA